MKAYWVSNCNVEVVLVDFLFNMNFATNIFNKIKIIEKEEEVQ